MAITDLNARDASGYTPVVLAVQSIPEPLTLQMDAAYAAVARTLIAQGADTTMGDGSLIDDVIVGTMRESSATLSGEEGRSG